MNNEKLHRLHVNIDEATYMDFRNTIHWGLRNALVSAILKTIVEAVKQDGMMMVGAVLSGKYKLVIDDEDDDSAKIRRSQDLTS